MHLIDLFPFSIEDLIVYRWPRRVVLGLALCGMFVFADLGALAPRVLIGALIFLWLASEMLDVILLKRRNR